MMCCVCMKQDMQMQSVGRVMREQLACQSGRLLDVVVADAGIVAKVAKLDLRQVQLDVDGRRLLRLVLGRFLGGSGGRLARATTAGECRWEDDDACEEGQESEDTARVGARADDPNPGRVGRRRRGGG